MPGYRNDGKKYYVTGLQSLQLYNYLSFVQFQFPVRSQQLFFSNGLLSSQHLKDGKCPRNQKLCLKMQDRQKKDFNIVSAR